MLTLSGLLYNIASSEQKDDSTGEIKPVRTAEILHTARGKSEITGLKLDPAVWDAWGKCKGKDISVEVRFYAMKNREGGVMSGLSLADKKALPMVASAVKLAA